MDTPSRPRLARIGVALLVVALLTPAAVSAVTYTPADFKAGNVSSPANATTYVGIQGFHFEGHGATKKPARLAAVGPRGTLEWTFNGNEVGARWFYDVDVLPNGNLLAVSTNPGGTVVYEFDPETQSAVWTEHFEFTDTHDVDRINGDQLLIANMRNYNETTGKNNDRILIYDRGEDRIVWQWKFRNHGYEPAGGGDYTDDWTHVNDVDKISNGRYLVSPRNFDQVIVVNRSTKEIEMRLGSDGNTDVLNAQHNPDFLVSDDGHPTLLVADSHNNRVVEYERRCEGGDPMTAPKSDCSWERTWTVGTGQFNWPRDADRLPNGNTLITDSLNHRIVEVRPDGTIVWEYYATWAPYDADRPKPHHPSNRTSGSTIGPTIADMNASGSYHLSGSANDPPVPRTGVGDTAVRALNGTALEPAAKNFAKTWSLFAPWAKPVWMSGWDFLLSVLAALIVVGWGVVEVALHRDRIRAAASERIAALR